MRPIGQSLRFRSSGRGPSCVTLVLQASRCKTSLDCTSARPNRTDSSTGGAPRRRYANTAALADTGVGLIVYIEAAGHDAATICRNLHGMRLNGFFDHASAVLVGRTYAPDVPTLAQDEAVADALTRLGGPYPGCRPVVNGCIGFAETSVET